MEEINSRRSGIVGRARYVARLACVGSVTLLVGNCLIVAVVGSEFRWRLSVYSEIVNTGTGIAYLWTAGGGSSVALDCLPGMLPEARFSERYVFVDFPLWIPVLVSAFAWALLSGIRRFPGTRPLTAESSHHT